MHKYFVKYETPFVVNSFLVENDNASLAWDEATAYIEERHPDEDSCVITVFQKVE